MVKKITRFRPALRTKNTSADILRAANKEFPLLPFRSVIRLGSTTDFPDSVSNGGSRKEINTVKSIENSRSKLLMKQCFDDASVRSATWFTHITKDDSKFYLHNKDVVIPIFYPILAKKIFGQKAKGMIKIDDETMLIEHLSQSNSGYYYERFHNYSKEYRLHVSKNGCFYTNRKMLKQDADIRWYRNDSNCIWYLEDNEHFDKPINWKEIEEHCVKALHSVGLDVGACDVRVQSSKNPEGRTRDVIDFIIIEINSAPAFGTITGEKYVAEITKLLIEK